ncbi:MAG: hypothetical protein K8I30_04460, partial [Anaerolineae bacterium]|nr:hypothetical protein [Anaerolineae bacterium]
GNPRISDGNPEVDPTEVIEIGAFELTPLTALAFDTDRREDIFDNLVAFRVNLNDAVEGGFPPLKFTVKTPPQNYSTVTGDTCSGAGLRIDEATGLAFYCPPTHFYTHQGNLGAPTAEIVEPVTFEFTVEDVTGDISSNTITLRIFDEPDPALTPTDNIDYRFLARIDEPFGFRLRPFVRFNNFRLSERGTPRENKAQYPYAYGGVSVFDDSANAGEPNYNPFLFSDETDAAAARLESQTYIANAVAGADPDTGVITLDPQPNQLGVLRFTYTVTDEDGGTVTNEVRLEVVGTIPDRGLHDDTSFNFHYNSGSLTAPMGWTALYSETNINNTLHQTRNLNDSASFSFIGEGFTVYMMAIRSGGNWELKIDDSATPINWTKQGTEWFGVVTGESYTCRTRAPILTNLISNRGSAPYTVACSGLRDAEANEVKIINKQAGRMLQVDAFSILFEGDPLLPGYHDMNEPDVLPNFFGWPLISDRAASKGVAVGVTQTPVPDVSFRFIGSGFSLGTVLEGWGRGVAFAGASYDVCVTPNGSTEEVCQTFNNSQGGTTRAVWGISRPFFGFDPEVSHEVTIHVNSIPPGGRLVIDSITVFGDEPTGPLGFGTTENEAIGALVFGSGMDDSWVFDTRNTKASNSTLHSMN